MLKLAEITEIIMEAPFRIFTLRQEAIYFYRINIWEFCKLLKKIYTMETPNSKVEFESRIWNSNSKLQIRKSNSKVEFESRIWNSNSKLEIKTRNRNL